MCGIVGFINCGNKQELSEAVSVIKHRCSDYHGVKWFDNLNSGLGYARLLIPFVIQPTCDVENMELIEKVKICNDKGYFCKQVN